MQQRRGRPRIYADTAIECALVVKAVFHLSLRATQGFLESVVKLMDVTLRVPDYTTVSRRQAGLNVRLGSSTTGAPRHAVIDSTGLKVYGAGEYAVSSSYATTPLLMLSGLVVIPANPLF